MVTNAPKISVDFTQTPNFLSHSPYTSSSSWQGTAAQQRLHLHTPCHSFRGGGGLGTLSPLHFCLKHSTSVHSTLEKGSHTTMSKLKWGRGKASLPSVWKQEELVICKQP